MHKGEGKGKVILLGEHFVVHGAPALAAGIENKVFVEVEPADKTDLITKQYVIREMSFAGINAVFKAMNIGENFRIHLTGNLPTTGGLGSSAAFCVALVRALASYKGLNLTKEEVNRYAFEGERAFHGNPSGIDNFVATYGGIVIFKKGEEFHKFIEPMIPVNLVVSYTGKISETPKMIERVRKFREGNEERFMQLMDEASELVYRGANAVERGKIEELGLMMNQNQTLLSEIGVSIEENDEVTGLMRDAGALGAKLTGGGGGGCCVALVRDKIAGLEVERTLKKRGYESFSTSVLAKS